MPDPGALLLTGATGFLGQELLARIVARSDRPVVALVRAADDAAAQARVDGVLAALGEPAGRVRGVAADLERDDLGLGALAANALAADVTTIVHCAASVSFGLSLEASRAVNVEGTRRMLDLALRCAAFGDGLERFAYISTAYVAGRHPGRFGPEDLWHGQRFRNPYEQSKCEAELLVRAAGEELPVQVLRPSIVMGDRRTGWTTSFNVLYQPLRAFGRGLLTMVPGRAEAPVDVVPVDYVADGVLALLDEPLRSPQTHLLVAGDRAATVGGLGRLAGRYFGRPAPELLDPERFERELLPALRRNADSRTRAVLESSAALFPYFAVETRFDDPRTRALLEARGVRCEGLESYLPRLLDFAVQTRWGRRLPARAEVLAAA
ncbi:MAG: SDR family oxidoreductase [Solirubrobacterales bacterium]|nr:SDR family oxidoreductase [Solirubrobacterales bacterium]